MTTAVKVHAPRRKNGVPRAAWLVYDERGNRVALIPADYQGMTTLRGAYPDAVVLDHPAAIHVVTYDSLAKWANR